MYLCIENTLQLAMGERIKKLKKIRIHREGTSELLYSAILVVAIATGLWYAFDTIIPCVIFSAIFVTAWLMALNFYRCPIRYFNGDTERTVVAPADGKVVVIEEVEENEYFHDKRLMISIFMSLTNVHANWIPCEGTVVKVAHQDGNYLKAYLPKASTENECSMVVIRTSHGVEVMARQIAGALARRIVTYPKEGEECFIDDHMGFIKFGSRVDVYLPLGTEVLVKMGQRTVGNETVIAKLK